MLKNEEDCKKSAVKIDRTLGSDMPIVRQEMRA